MPKNSPPEPALVFRSAQDEMAGEASEPRQCEKEHASALLDGVHAVVQDERMSDGPPTAEDDYGAISAMKEVEDLAMSGAGMAEPEMPDLQADVVMSEAELDSEDEVSSEVCAVESDGYGELPPEPPHAPFPEARKEVSPHATCLHLFSLQCGSGARDLTSRCPEVDSAGARYAAPTQAWPTT